jgi:zinc/manganese transport system substrate-binding protein
VPQYVTGGRLAAAVSAPTIAHPIASNRRSGQPPTAIHNSLAQLICAILLRNLFAHISLKVGGRANGVLATVAIPLLMTGCGIGSGSASAGSSTPACPSGQAVVVAAENFWGSIASQLGGDRVCVRSIIVNPDTDPHAYEATPSDARLIAGARYVIVNGAGYDPWAPKLIGANPVPGRVVLTVGDFVGKKEGDNPHLWYSPVYVQRVVEKVNADLDAIDPRDAAYFDQQKAQYLAVGLKNYVGTLATIKQKYHGTPVGATESIFVYVADATSLNLVTPPEYMKAISEGTDPSAADKAAIERQISSRSIKVFVFNSQNSTKDVLALVDKARAQKIPVVALTETLAPAGATFQDWQTKQLQDLFVALGG